MLLDWETGRYESSADGGGKAVVLFNYSGKEINAKVVYYGPGLSGKTTNLEHIYNKMAPHLRGKMVSMKTKSDRTLFFDFLPIEGGEIAGFDVRFLLYTVPGQVYYNATRKLVLKGADAIVFVADSQSDELPANRESLNNLRENLKEYGKTLNDIPWVIQYNKRDLESALPVAKLEEELNPDRVPYFEAVATNGDGVFETLQAATKLVMEQLRAQLGEESSKSKSSGGQAVELGLLDGPDPAREAESQVCTDSSLTEGTSPNVPSPGDEFSPALGEAACPCPPDSSPVAVSTAYEPSLATAGRHMEASIECPGLDGCGEAQLKIPVRVKGNGKPAHVIVNFAVDVEILVDEEET
jgi:signal recognition particle receptor subunit beta